MANKDYYSILWINKSATEAEIKKAYRKKAMEWHPDKHKWDKKAEEKFKEINEAYQILWDPKKKSQFDSFGSVWWDFSWFSWGAWFEWMDDIFKWFNSWNYKYKSSNYDFSDIFWNMFSQNSKKSQQDPFSSFSWSSFQDNPKKNSENLDVEKIYEVPIFDLILWCKLDIQTVYNENLKLKISEWTKPWTRFKIKWKWRSSSWKTWDMYVVVEAKMPKNIPEDVKKLLESIKFRL